MYYSDKPIEKFEDDLLGRKNFAKQLGKAILSLTPDENITIGLYGKWGTGKTSIINMTVKEISEITKTMDKDLKPLIVRFEPWNFSNTDNLISLFFKELNFQFHKKSDSRISIKVGAAIESYSEALTLVESVPNLNVFARLLKYTASLIGKQMQSNSIDISTKKEKLKKELIKQKRKIIVIIDDIDRLGNEQIRTIFQLVNQVAGLPNILYLLSMDKDVVIRALEKVQECKGEEYLEKIIQVPFSIPDLNKDKVLTILLDKLEEIYTSEINIQFDDIHWNKVYQNCIYPFIHSIRDVNRVLNTFRFKFDMVNDEVDFSDMIGITVLQVLQPGIYQWIVENQASLCGGISEYTPTTQEDQNIKKMNYIQQFESANLDAKKTITVLSTLFPKFDKEVNPYYEVISEDELRKHQRISHANRFKLYYNLDISDIPFTRSQLLASIRDMDISDLMSLGEQINNSGEIVTYLQGLKSMIDDIPYNRIQLIIRFLYSSKLAFRGHTSSSIFSASAKRITENIIESLMHRINTPDERYRIYYETISHADFNILASISIDINRIELNYGRLAGTNNTANKYEHIISLLQLEQLEKEYVERLKFLIKEKDIFEVDSLLFIVYLWKNFDRETCLSFIHTLLAEDLHILKFIIRLSEEWIGTTGKGWTFSKRNYEEFVSTSRIVDAITNSIKTGNIASFKNEELVKVASFILNLDKGNLDYATEKEAKDLIKTW